MDVWRARVRAKARRRRVGRDVSEVWSVVIRRFRFGIASLRVMKVGCGLVAEWVTAWAREGLRNVG